MKLSVKIYESKSMKAYCREKDIFNSTEKSKFLRH